MVSERDMARQADIASFIQGFAYYRDNEYNYPPNHAFADVNTRVQSGLWLRLADPADRPRAGMSKKAPVSASHHLTYTIRDIEHGGITDSYLLAASGEYAAPDGPRCAIYVSPFTHSAQKALNSAGFSLSHHFPEVCLQAENPQELEQFLKESRHIPNCAGVLDPCGLFTVSGMTYRSGETSGESVVEKCTNTHDIGTWASHRGVIALVDLEGEICIGCDTQELRHLLQHLGLKENPALRVPFTHDEKPVRGAASEKTVRFIEYIQKCPAYSAAPPQSCAPHAQREQEKAAGRASQQGRQR